MQPYIRNTDITREDSNPIIITLPGDYSEYNLVYGFKADQDLGTPLLFEKKSILEEIELDYDDTKNKTKITIYRTSSDTANLQPGTYYHEIEVQSIEDPSVRLTIMQGRLTLLGDVINQLNAVPDVPKKILILNDNISAGKFPIKDNDTFVDSSNTDSEIQEAVEKAHSHVNTDSEIQEAVEKVHSHVNTDSEIQEAVEKAHSHTNQEILDATEESFTTYYKDKIDGKNIAIVNEGESIQRAIDEMSGRGKIFDGTVSSYTVLDNVLYARGVNGLYRYNNTNNSWKKLFDSSIYDFYVCSNSIIVKLAGAVYKISLDDGNSWSNIPYNFSHIYVHNSLIMAVINSILYVSVDSGVNWNSLCEWNESGFLAHKIDDSLLIFSSVSEKVYLIRSDGSYTILFNKNAVYLEKTDINNVYLNIYKSDDFHLIYKSSDYGETWNRVLGVSINDEGYDPENPWGLPGIYIMGINLMKRIDNVFYVQAYGVYNGNEGQYLFRSEDEGLTWENVLDSAILYTIDNTSLGTLITWSEANNKIYRSLDNGKTWTSYSSSFSSPQFFIKSSVIFCIDYGESNVYLSSDDGLTWTLIAESTIKLYFNNTINKIYLIGSDSKPYYSLNNGLTWNLIEYSGTFASSMYFIGIDVFIHQNYLYKLINDTFQSIMGVRAESKGVVVINPGSYNQVIKLYDNVHLHFMPGAKLINDSIAAGCISEGEALTEGVRITGRGIIKNLYNSGSSWYCGVKIEQTTSKVSIECDTIECVGGTSVNLFSGTCVESAALEFKLKCNKVISQRNTGFYLFNSNSVNDLDIILVETGTVGSYTTGSSAFVIFGTITRLKVDTIKINNLGHAISLRSGTLYADVRYIEATQNNASYNIYIIHLDQGNNNQKLYLNCNKILSKTPLNSASMCAPLFGFYQGLEAIVNGDTFYIENSPTTMIDHLLAGHGSNGTAFNLIFRARYVSVAFRDVIFYDFASVTSAKTFEFAIDKLETRGETGYSGVSNFWILNLKANVSILIKNTEIINLHSGSSVIDSNLYLYRMIGGQLKLDNVRCVKQNGTAGSNIRFHERNYNSQGSGKLIFNKVELLNLSGSAQYSIVANAQPSGGAEIIKGNNVIMNKPAQYTFTWQVNPSSVIQSEDLA